MRVWTKVVAACVLALGSAFVPEASAESLVEKLNSLVEVSLVSQNHQAHFSNDAASQFGAVTSTLASSAADFPAISSAPGFTYSYDPDLGMYTRQKGSLGTVFVERARTIGYRKIEVGASYVYLNFTELDGEDLDGFSRVLNHQPDPDEEYAKDKAEITFEEFSLQSHFIDLFFTYGVLENWDVNLVVPVVHTELDATARKTLIDPQTQQPGDGPYHEFEGGRRSTTDKTDGSKTGIGDVLFRTKYRFLHSNSGLDLASTLALRLPTGRQDDFQGLGDVVVTPGFAGTWGSRRIDVYANLGFDLNVDDVERSRVRYGLGTSVSVVERLSVFAEVFGSSGLTNREVRYDVKNFNDTGEDFDIETKSIDIRTDLVDVAAGLKVNVFGDAVFFAGAAVPVTDDGLRPTVVPVGGIEIPFSL